MPLLRAELRRKHQLLYPTLIHDPSQVIYLPFDEDDGSYARDRSGDTNHGTIYGASRGAGKIGDGLSFDGVDDYVNVPHSASLDLTSRVTLMAWVYPTRTPLAYDDLVNKNDRYMIHWEYGTLLPKFVFKIPGLQEWKSVTSPEAVVINTWNHIVGVYDKDAGANNMKLYVNSELKAQATYTDSIESSPYALTIGRFSDRYFGGIIDEVRIFNRALSAAEIVRVMNMRGI